LIDIWYTAKDTLDLRWCQRELCNKVLQGLTQ